MAGKEYPLIINGPSKFDLMLALFEGKEVQFEIPPMGIIRVEIDSLRVDRFTIGGRDPRSEEKWLITGTMLDECKGFFSTFDAEFSSKTRRGRAALLRKPVREPGLENLLICPQTK